MRFVYLEAGSGAKSSVTPEMVKTVRHTFNGFLIVGGGIKDVETAESLVKAGADALVIGTFLEKGGSLTKLEEIANKFSYSYSICDVMKINFADKLFKDLLQNKQKSSQKGLYLAPSII